MRYKYRTCILLTACVSPSGMSHTVLQNPETRAEQYKKALDFYINETNVPIVFCENTMYDMSPEYKQYIDSGRLEYLTFDGNNYDINRGKGYGEALIMGYAINHSDIIRNSKYVIKITGRIIISDIKRYLSSPLYLLDNLFRSNIKPKFISTYIFIVRPKLLQQFIEKYQELIWEDHPTNDLIEHHWYRALTKDSDFNKTRYIPFFIIPNVIGVSGTTGQKYSMKDRLIGNLIYSYRLEKDRDNRFIAIPYLFAYYIHLFIDRVSVRLGIKEKSYF